jgi:hypothetical protein
MEVEVRTRAVNTKTQVLIIIIRKAKNKTGFYLYKSKLNLMETNQAETIFYQDANVTVTQSRFIASSKTYAMRNISSVSLFKIEKSKTGPLILMGLGLLLLFGDGTRVMGVILIVVGLFWIMNIKDEYSVRISTNAGESNSLVSKDESYIQKIVNALNEAIIHRG